MMKDTRPGASKTAHKIKKATQNSRALVKSSNVMNNYSGLVKNTPSAGIVASPAAMMSSTMGIGNPQTRMSNISNYKRHKDAWDFADHLKAKKAYASRDMSVYRNQYDYTENLKREEERLANLPEAETVEGPDPTLRGKKKKTRFTKLDSTRG